MTDRKPRVPRRPRTSVPALQPPLAVSETPFDAAPAVVATVSRDLTKSVIFSLLWMAIVAAYIFAGPRNYGPVPVAVAWLVVGTTVFSLIVLGKRFPMFGYFLIVMITARSSAAVGVGDGNPVSSHEHQISSHLAPREDPCAALYCHSDV